MNSNGATTASLTTDSRAVVLDSADHLAGVLPHHLKELRASGLTDETIKAAGITSETKPDALASVLNMRRPRKGIAPAIKFPYRNADGNNGYYRIKSDTPRIDQNGKPVKYESPRGRPNEIYLTPIITAAVLENPEFDLYFTEGEKKSLALSQLGLHTIGIPGVYAWKVKGSEGALLAMERIALKGRKVYIVFDSDAAENQNVLDAESRLAKWCQDRGAAVRVVRISHGGVDTDGKPIKLGADDFIVAHGADKFLDLVNNAQEPEPVVGPMDKPSANTADSAPEAERYLDTEHCTGGHRLLVRHRSAFYRYRLGRYVEIPDDEIRSDCVRFLNKRFTHVAGSTASNLMEQLKAQTMLPASVQSPAWLDGEPPFLLAEALACRNGLIHLPSLVRGESVMVPATPNYFSTCALDIDFDLDAMQPVAWLKLLNDLWEGDQQSIALLQEWFGYLLTADTSLQKILMLVGPPRAGKGVIVRVLIRLLGAANVASPSFASFAGPFGLWPLLNRTLAVFADARLSGRADQAIVVERLLRISGEDACDIDRKCLPSLAGVRLPTRLMLVSNELPRLADSSGALSERILMLRLRKSFAGREDSKLTDKLAKELGGILLWAIAGWQRLHERGRFVAADSTLELMGEMRDLASPVAAFVRQRCRVEPLAQVVRADLYADFKAWSVASGRNHVEDEAGFGRMLRAAVPCIGDVHHRVGGKQTRFYSGIALAD